MTNNKKAAGSNMDNFKDGASLVGGAVADVASAIAASVSVAASDTGTAAKNTASAVGNSLGKARKQAARRVKTVVAKAKSATGTDKLSSGGIVARVKSGATKAVDSVKSAVAKGEKQM
ncbi:MAG: hypothetical protein WBP11_01775, partial [Dokdonella sp.]